MKIHFMGVGGSGMAGVAKLASNMGYDVTGCDLQGSTAYSTKVSKGHSVNHLKGVGLLVISPAILYQGKNNPEYAKALLNKMVITWEQFLGEDLLKNKKVIAVAGTHGKSTTTAMIGKMLEDNGFDPTVVIGANVKKWGGGVRVGKGDWAVVEADEFNDNFLYYHPDIIILNNIEFDHPDYFKNELQVKKSFDKFIKNLKGDKILITQKNNKNKKFNLKVMGEHNQKNANMAFVLGKKLDLSDEKIIKSLESFQGIGRRMEYLGKSKSGLKVYDDYAHHPTAIKTTLEGLREKYLSKKIIAIVEPHGFKRTKAMLKNYKGIFDAVDKVIVGPIYKARDKVDKSITPQKVAKASGHQNAVGVNVFRISDLDIRDCDVVVVMGAGKSYLWAKEILKI